jgi:hypothetical protein
MTRPALAATALLLHAERPVGPRGRQHALEWVEDPDAFVADARRGGGSAWTSAATQAGVPFTVVRRWPDCTAEWRREHLLGRVGWPYVGVGLERL